MPFQKGNRANPGGRPKDLAWVKHLARKQTEQSIRTLVDLRDDVGQDGRVRAMAAESLINRGWGKPATEDVVERLDLQRQRLEAEVALLESKVKEIEGSPATALIPGSPEYDEMLLREWGFSREYGSDGRAKDGQAAESADPTPDR